MAAALGKCCCCCLRKVNNEKPLKQVPQESPNRSVGHSGILLNAMDRHQVCAPPCGWHDLDSDQPRVKWGREGGKKRHYSHYIKCDMFSQSFICPYLRIQRWWLEAELVNVGKERPVQLLAGSRRVKAALSLLFGHDFRVTRRSFNDKLSCGLALE